MDRNGNLFFVLMNPMALACWDTSTPYTTHNVKILVRNDVTLQFASGLKIIQNLKGVEELWVVTIRFQVCEFKNMKLNIIIRSFSYRKYSEKQSILMKSITAFRLSKSINF